MRVLFCLLLCTTCLGQTTETLYLSGIDKDHTVTWDFFCTHGRNSGYWSKIEVPSNWELQGFGSYNWGRDKMLSNEKGLYRHAFTVPLGWKNKKIFLVFEASMTDTEVKINGRSAGPVHQGGFYRFQYDVTSLVRCGAQNRLEVTVCKMSANASVNEAERTADYWVFGGIYRPVYLQAFPREYIERVAIDARQDGSFRIDVFSRTQRSDRQILVQLKQQGRLLPGSWTAAAAQACVQGRVEDPKLWSPEFPHLYTAVIRLQQDERVLHSMEQRFGFRTVEVRPHDGIYVNDNKIMFRGVCRHCFWPESGRCTSRPLSLQDVNLIKEMNMNAVRMSHYPPDAHFLDVCDSLGLFVIDELAGWQYPPYDTPVGKKLVAEMIHRDVNHPSIVLWANGNEGGFNYELLPDYAEHDPQKRTVIHPWETLNGLNTFHYFPWDYGVGTVFHGKEVFFPTEVLHGMYDGGLGAGLDDYWNSMLSNPLSAGAFLWVFCDEGVLRRDLGDSLDTCGNMGPDGILGPYREKEGSFYTIRDIWSPIQFEKKIITNRFDGSLTVHNRFDETSLQQCRFACDWVRFDGFFPQVKRRAVSGKVLVAEAPPQGKGSLRVALPESWQQYDALYLTAWDPYDRLINQWCWNLSTPQQWSARAVQPGVAPVVGAEDNGRITLSCGDLMVQFDKRTGLLSRIEKNSRTIPLTNGPRWLGVHPELKELRLFRSTQGQGVEWIYDGPVPCRMQWTMQDGGLCLLEYTYQPPTGAYDLLGITFSYPESLVTGATLLADGPYRVWKNRMRGPLFGLYNKEYNDTVTGESWIYPEFKGYYSRLYAVEVQAGAASFSAVSATEDLFLHLFTPKPPKGAVNDRTVPLFPHGDLSFLHTITAIGNKSHSAELTGPQGCQSRLQPNRNSKGLSAKLYFVF